MRRAETGDHLRLALESADAPDTPACVAPADQLDGGGPRQHAMPRAPDFAHPALSELLLQPIAPQLACALDLGAQLIHDAGTDVGHAHDEEIREHEPEEELADRAERSGAGRHHDPDDDGDRAHRRQGGHERAAWRCRHDDREQHDPDGDPRQAQEARWFRDHGIAELGGGDGVAADDLERQAEFITWEAERGGSGSPPRRAAPPRSR